MNKVELATKAAQLLYSTGVVKVLAPLYGGIGSILMLHRLIDERESELNHSLCTTTAFLDKFIGFLKSQQIDIISLDQMVYRLSHQTTQQNRFVCFTFDDGYRDNLTLALPIFENHQVPFAVYITAGLIERQFPYWGRILETLFKTQDQLAFNYGGTEFQYLENQTYEDKLRNFTAFMKVVHFDRDRAQERVQAIGEKFGIDQYHLLDQDALNLDELKKLAASPLVTIGAHTVNHANLSSLDEMAAFHEMTDSKRYLETHLGKPISHFAYPFGDRLAVSTRELALAEKAGFVTSTTTQPGTLKHHHCHHRQRLPRLAFNIKFESLELMELMRSGIVSQLTHRTLLPTT